MQDFQGYCFLLVSAIITLASPAGNTARGDDSLFRVLAQADPPSIGERNSSGETRTAAINEVPNEHPLLPAIRLAQGSLVKMQTVTDYEANFIKRERVNGQLTRQAMLMRFREKPHSIYLRYAGDEEGREVLFVQGRNGNQMYAHEGGGFKSLIGTVSMAPDGVEAMQDNRYPITHFGMKRMLETVLAQWQEETKFGECDVKFYPDAKLGSRPCKVVEASHPQARRQFKFHKTRLFIDAETKLPVRVEQYGFPTQSGGGPQLEEEYTYSEIRIAPGFSDHVFNKENPEYSF